MRRILIRGRSLLGGRKICALKFGPLSRSVAFHEPLVSAPRSQRCCVERIFHTACVKALELCDGMTHMEWNTRYWTEKGKATRSKSGIAPTFKYHSLRGTYFVLMQCGKEFHTPEDNQFEDLCDYFSSPDVIATTHISRNDTKAISIQNKFHSIKEWDAMVDFSVEHSRNTILSHLMNFILLHKRNTIKIDQNVNTREHIAGPLVTSYLDFIFAEQNVEFCQRPLLNYLNLCRNIRRYDLIESAYGRAKSLCKVFNIGFMRESFGFLGHTKYWKDLFQFRDVLKVYVNESDKIDVTVARTALINGEKEMAFGIMGNLFHSLSNRPTEPIYDKFMRTMLSLYRYDTDPATWEHNRELVETFFLCLSNASVFPHGDHSAEAIANWFAGIQNEKWKYNIISSSDIRFCRCPFTGVILKKKTLSDEEYDSLAKMVLTDILLSKPAHDLSLTYPVINENSATEKREVKSFTSLVYESGPFDLVVDGMNLVYGIGHRVRKENHANLAKLACAWLRNTVQRKERHAGRKMNVLVVFRNHMRKTIDNNYDDFATVWYSADDSEDDPYFLYAAILSGRNCRLMTLDHMKNVQFLLRHNKYKAPKLIYKWQQIHQDLFFQNPSKQMSPQLFDVCTQRTSTTWHFPYYSKPNLLLPDMWLCLKRVN